MAKQHRRCRNNPHIGALNALIPMYTHAHVPITVCYCHCLHVGLVFMFMCLSACGAGVHARAEYLSPCGCRNAVAGNVAEHETLAGVGNLSALPPPPPRPRGAPTAAGGAALPGPPPRGEINLNERELKKLLKEKRKAERKERRREKRKAKKAKRAAKKAAKERKAEKEREREAKKQGDDKKRRKQESHSTSSSSDSGTSSSGSDSGASDAAPPRKRTRHDPPERNTDAREAQVDGRHGRESDKERGRITGVDNGDRHERARHDYQSRSPGRDERGAGDTRRHDRDGGDRDGDGRRHGRDAGDGGDRLRGLDVDRPVRDERHGRGSHREERRGGDGLVRQRSRSQGRDPHQRSGTRDRR